MERTRVGAELIRKELFRVPEESGYISDHMAQYLCGHPSDLEHAVPLLKMGFVTKRFYAGVVPALAMPR